MPSTLPSILIVIDDQEIIQSLENIIEEQYEVFSALDTKSAGEILHQEWIQVMICNQRIPETSGIDFCKQIKDEYPEIISLIISGYTESSDITNAIKAGNIYQYIARPWQKNQILSKLANAITLFNLYRKLAQLKVEMQLKPDSIEQTMLAKRQILQTRLDWDMGIIRSPKSPVNRICNLIRNVAAFDVHVMLLGESGTDKGSYARAIHDNSLRQNEKFITQNCAGLSDEMLERQLFGYKRGAFIGAKDDKIGLLVKANKGTIYLNEIDEASTAFQLKLLQILLDGEVYPIGSNRAITINIRVIAATDHDLNEKLANGSFRRDLFYRIATFDIHIPPIRKRREDIIPLAITLLNQNMELLGKKVNGISDEALKIFESYDWPGNIVEMNNEVKRMLVLGQQDYLGADIMSAHILHATPQESKNDMDYVVNAQGSLKQRMESLETILVKEVLIKNKWNQTKAAIELGLSRVGLRNKIERYGLEKNDKVIAMDELSKEHSP
ncbi:MAG: sigma-54 dependent transcriptional regulator [Proteobacteria bacterium]|nr:sigma-54 dependent transcriptional regulator [Pseudomonadota bacterium]